MLLEVKNISKKYGEQTVLNDVNMSFDEGCVVGLLGPNGAGKSTLMKIITGFVNADNGKARIDGMDVSIDTQRIVGYLPEHNPLYTEMYVAEYLEFVGRTYKVVNLKERVNEVIDTVGLTPERHKKIGQLSKGYRQRVGLAAAIIHDPKILILDEPTTGLDPNQLSDIRSVICELGKSRLVILSTHIMQEVEAMCDDVVMLDHGVVKVSGKKSDLLKKYGSMENIFKELEVNG